MLKPTRIPAKLATMPTYATSRLKIPPSITKLATRDPIDGTRNAQMGRTSDNVENWLFIDATYVALKASLVAAR